VVARWPRTVLSQWHHTDGGANHIAADVFGGLAASAFSGQFLANGTGTSGYDVSLDGRQFLMLQPTEPDPPGTRVGIVINWFDELRRLAPVQK
jgi:hypothetical protein